MSDWKEYLYDKDYTVTSGEAAENKHFLNQAEPLLRLLKDLERTQTRCLSQEDRDVLRSAIHMLDGAMVPQSLLKIDDSDEIAYMKKMSGMLGKR